MHGNAFVEIAAILGIATVLGLVGQKLRQPLLIMFLATGILAGPSVFGIIGSYEQIELLAHIGIAILLFIVGLRLDLNLIRTTGPVSLATGLGQIVFTSTIGFIIALAFDMPLLTAAYVSVALTFSSTIIIVKLLSDKKEIDSLHGQIAIGFLIVQDIAAILALVALTTFGSAAGAAETGTAFQEGLLIAVEGLGLLGVIAFLTKYILPPLTRRLAHSQELLILFAITWAVGLGAGSEWLGFSKEVGAFLAGISLASSGYRDAIGARLTTLRDFLLLFFFIDLGSRLDWSAVGTQVGPAVLFSLFVLIGNPLIVLAIMGIMGYRRRTGFLAGLTVAQISEFSLILAALGLTLGHITPETMGLITLVGVVTIFASTYMILYSGPLYSFLSGPLKVFERSHPNREAAADTLKAKTPVDVILAGLGTYGGAIAEQLMRRRMTIVGVDFDPGALKTWCARGVFVLYGDVADPEIHEQLPLGRARWVVSAVRSRDLNLSLLDHLKRAGYEGKIALTAADGKEADLFKKAGAHVVFRPHVDAAEQAADSLTHAMDLMPDQVDWPVTFLESRIRTGASAAGRTIRELPLPPEAGVFILAVSRGGRIHYNPGPDFQIFPGDRLVITGPPEGLEKAEKRLDEPAGWDVPDTAERFQIAEIGVAGDSKLSGRTLADINFRQAYGVTVIGLRRGDERITTISPSEKLLAGDSLIVIGLAGRIASLEAKGPL